MDIFPVVIAFLGAMVLFWGWVAVTIRGSVRRDRGLVPSQPSVTTVAEPSPVRWVAATAPVVTAPVVTAPVVTAPVVTAPVVTAPVVTAPVVTAPPPRRHGARRHGASGHCASGHCAGFEPHPAERP